jgi:hypothetical protein
MLAACEQKWQQEHHRAEGWLPEEEKRLLLVGAYRTSYREAGPDSHRTARFHRFLFMESRSDY